jgi:hypothetical protein
MVVVSVIIERLAGVFLFAGARPFPLGSRSARLRRTAARPQAEPWLDSDGKTCVGSLAQQRLSATVRRSGEDNAAREYGQEWIIPTTSGSTSWLRPHKRHERFPCEGPQVKDGVRPGDEEERGQQSLFPMGRASRKAKSNRAKRFGSRKPKVVKDAVPDNVRALDPTVDRESGLEVFRNI